MHKGRNGGFSSIVHPLFVLGLKLRNLTFFFFLGEMFRIFVVVVRCVEK